MVLLAFAAGGSSSERKRSRPIRAFSATPHDGQRRCRTLLKIPAESSSELRIPGAAAQTRVVSLAGIRLGSWESAQAFKGIICDDVSEFESHMPSHAVGSLWGDGDPKGSPQSGGRRKTGVPNKVNSARVERALAHFTKQLRAPDCACATTAWLRRMAPKAHQGLRP